jgi:uncharacterized protein (TIGR03382 family)
VTTSGNLLGTVSGADPGFVSGTDFHLSAASAARDIGLANPLFVDNTGAAQLATPTQEFQAPQGTTARPLDCILDDGAYEFDTGVACDGGTTVPDSGSPGSDSGTPGRDGGSTGSDAGPTSGPDGGGSPDGGGGTAKAGCSCNGVDGSVAAAVALALAMTLRRRRGH